MERGLIYGRASRDPKHKGTSVDDQVKECRAWAENNGVEVVRVIRDDNRSASSSATRDREGFAEVMDHIKAGAIDILIVWESSRATRDLEDFVPLRTACRKAGVFLSYKGRRYDLNHTNDSFNASLDALLAERDASEIRDRIVRTVNRTAESKRPHGRLPYGYKRVYDPRTGSLIDQTPFVRVDPEGEPLLDIEGELIPALPGETVPMAFSPEAQALADAAKMLLADPPATLRSICRKFDARGIPSPRKPRQTTVEDDPAAVVSYWHPSSLRQLMLNPTIAGRRVHRKEDIGEASWAPIVDYNEWLRLRKHLTAPDRLTITKPRGPAPRHLLSNIALCHSCGARMKAATNMKRIPRAYVCRNEPCTKKLVVNAERAEQVVEDVLQELFNRPDYRKKLSQAHAKRQQAQHDGPDVAALIHAREAELGEVEQLREDGELTLRSYAKESKRIEDAIAELKEKEVASVSSPVLRKLLSASSLMKYWEDADLMDKRAVIRLLFTVTIKPVVTRGRQFDKRRVDVRPSETVGLAPG